MTGQRDLCLKCFRARRTCICAQVRPITPRTEFVILRHTLERKRSIGTAQMSRLCLSNSRLLNGRFFDDQQLVQEILADTGLQPYVLFPGPSSITLDTTSLNTEKQRVVFVIDGTWSDAKQILRFNPQIAALPRISFNPSKLSEYGFRRQPHPHCLSTVESIHRVLELTEPDLDASILLEVFRTMVQAQLEYSRNKITPRRVSA